MAKQNEMIAFLGISGGIRLADTSGMGWLNDKEKRIAAVISEKVEAARSRIAESGYPDIENTHWDFILVADGADVLHEVANSLMGVVKSFHCPEFEILMTALDKFYPSNRDSLWWCAMYHLEKADKMDFFRGEMDAIEANKKYAKLLETERGRRKEIAKAAIKERYAKDPIQGVKAKVKASWEKLAPGQRKYGYKTEFARNMMKEFTELKSQEVIIGWSRKWEKECNPT